MSGEMVLTNEPPKLSPSYFHIISRIAESSPFIYALASQSREPTQWRYHWNY